MALSAHYLLDTSVTARLGKEPVAKRIQPLIERGLVATCSLLDLEIGYTAQNLEEWEMLRADRALLYPWVPLPEDVFSRALALQGQLIAAGAHRGVGIPDLLIAVTAAFNSLTVLHYDHDFDLIATSSAVATEWVVPPGQAD